MFWLRLLFIERPIMEKLQIAIDYANKGWAVIALSPNSKIPLKHELQPNGVKNATTNKEIIMKLWSDYPDANIGIATGEMSEITVLDIDGMQGVEALKEIGFKFPETYIVQTPRGYHHYYLYDSSIQTSAGRVEKCDIRNNGGYVVAAGSTIDKKVYKAVKNVSLHECILPDIFREKPQVSREWMAKLSSEAITEGRRNNTLFRYGCQQRVNKSLSDSDITTLINKFNQERLNPPLTTNEVDRIVQSVLSYSQGDSVSFIGNLIEPPMIESQTDRRCTFFWTAYDVRVELSRINHTATNTYCRMKIWYEGSLIFFSSYSLYNDKSRKDTRDVLSQTVPLIDWHGVLRHITHVVNTSTEKDGDSIDLAAYKPRTESPYLLHPIIRENQPTIIYADGGSGKSTMALSIAASLATGKTFIQGFNPPGDNVSNTLYLDWEADEEDVSSLLQEIGRGQGIEMPLGRIIYKSMSGPFIDRVDALVDDIVENNIKLVIVDSLVASAGGDVNDADAARMYFQSVRSLKVASIGITHTNKENSLFGSRFFWNLARSVFRVESVTESEKNPIVGLFHEKANRSQLLSPMAWEVEYGDRENSYIRYKAVDVQSIPQLARKTGLREQIFAHLKGGDRSVEQIAAYLGVTPQQVTGVLYQYKSDFTLVDDNVWRLNSEM